MANLLNLIILSYKHRRPTFGARLDYFSYYKRGRNRRLKKILLKAVTKKL